MGRLCRLFVLLAIACGGPIGSGEEPCFCERLASVLEPTMSTLEARYGGASVLDAAAAVRGGGDDSDLQHRLLAHQTAGQRRALLRGALERDLRLW